MKILVCISQVPDTTTKIILKDNDTAINSQGTTGHIYRTVILERTVYCYRVAGTNSERAARQHGK